MNTRKASLFSILISLWIIFMSFLSILVANKLDRAIIEPKNSAYQPGTLTYELNQILDDSLFGLQPIGGGGRPLEYYLVSHKYANQYYNPDTNSEGENLTIDESTNTVTNFVTSRYNIRQIDPLALSLDDFSGRNVVLAQGRYTRNDGVDYQIHVTDQDNDKLNQYSEAMDELIPMVYNIDKDYGIIELTFAYVIDIDTEGFAQFDNYIDLNRSVIPNLIVMGILAIIIVSIFTFLVDYKYTYVISYYKWLKRIPIEIVLTLQILWLSPATSVLYYDSSYFNNLIIYIGGFILISTIQIAFIYYSLSVKSILLNGRNSFVIRNSLIYNFISFLIRQIKKLGNFIISSTENLGARTALIVCGLIFLSIFILIFIDPPEIVSIIVLGIIVYLIYRLLKRFFQDVKVIEEFTQEISNGNYEAKLNEDKVSFKAIIHNLNAIRDNLNLAVEDAIKSERMKSELITNVSHDLKTPLTSIINYSHLINKETDPSKIKNYADVVYERSTRLKVLIEDLFEVTKANTQNIELNYELLDFSQLVNQAVGEWEDKLEEKNLTVELNIVEDKILIKLDGNKTYRVLDNLLSNIYKYSMENTRVYIDLYIKDQIILEMKNISKYALNISSEELMERFTRGDESRNTEGSGLGLAISKSLVEAQGGSFDIEIIGDLYIAIIKFDQDSHTNN